MSQQIELLYDGLIALLPADSGLAGWATTHFSKSIEIIKANVPVEKIAADKLPAAIIEIGDTDTEVQVGGERQEAVHDLPFSMVWIENDAATAFTQRLQLHDLMIQALMTSGTLGVAGASAWISEAQSDKNIFHPRHVMRFQATASYTVYKP